MRFLLVFFFLLVQLPFSSSHSFAGNLDSREYALKAGFIFNFTKFIQWPEAVGREINSSGFKFCLAGENPFENVLDAIAEKLKEENRNLVVIPRVSFEVMPHCHILFVSHSEHANVNHILLQVRKYPVLVIGDTPGFAEECVNINFFIQKNQLRFEINREALESGGLVVSSELLNLARIVTGRK